MLTIRKSQLKVLGSYMAASFKTESIRYLKKKYPVTTRKFSDESLRSLVERAIENAARYKIDDPAPVRSYLEYALCMGIDFDTQSGNVWVSRCLGLRQAHGSVKMKELEKNVPLKPEFQ